MKSFNHFFATRTVIFIIMLILAMAFLFRIADIAMMFFAAFVLACTLNPAVAKMEKRMPRVLAVSIMLLVVLLLILGILIPLIALCADQLLIFLKHIPKVLAELETKKNLVVFGLKLENFIDPSVVKTYISSLGGDILGQSINATKIFANSLTTILAVTIMVFYIMSDSSMLKNGYLALFPPKFKKKASHILETIEVKVGGFVLAQLIAMAFVGILTAIGLAIIGHKHAILLGFLTGILDIIPVIGPTIAVGIGLYTSLKFGFVYVLIVFAIYIIAQWAQNQLLRPIVFGKLMDMHPLMIILSLLVGAQFMGFWGLILAPAIASVVCVLFDELYIKTINKSNCSETVCKVKEQLAETEASSDKPEES